MTNLSAITIFQPWATLIAEEVKLVEFRRWAAHARLVGKRIAIHAAARPIAEVEVRALLVKLHGTRWRETGMDRDKAIPLLKRVKAHPADFPRSAVLCTALLGKPVRGAELAAQLGMEAMNDSDRDEHSNWGWPLSDVRRVQPYAPATGKQGFWHWSPT